MDYKFVIEARNDAEKKKIVDGLVNSGYIVGVKEEGKEGYLITVYNKVHELNLVYEGCVCQKIKR